MKVSRFSRPVAADQLFEARLVDRNPAALQRPDLGRVLVDADDVVAVLGEARARDQSDIPGSDDRDFHECRLRMAEQTPNANTIAKIVSINRGVRSCRHNRLCYHGRDLRILLDYRPALRERTGVGEYVHEIAAALDRQPPRRPTR